MKRARYPIIPADSADRTGTAGLRRQAIAAINKRFDGLQAEVLAIFDAIRTLEANDVQVKGATTARRTVYALTPEELSSVSFALRQALDRWIASGREAAHSFWWSTFVGHAAQRGAAQASKALARLSDAYAAARSLRDILWSAPYRNRVAMAQIKSYEHWTGQAAAIKSELSQIIGRAVVDGKNPRAVRTEIAEKLGVSRAKAAQFAQTDVLDTLRQARWDEDDAAEAELGLQTAELWTSALTATTRSWHASRHGKAFSREECRAFYAQRGNLYNCRCATTAVLLDADGNMLITEQAKSSLVKEVSAWKRKHGDS